MTHEVGDLLFATVNVARLLHVDPELALREAGNRFERRVSGAAALAAAAGEDWSSLDLQAQEEYYQRAKGGETPAPRVDELPAPPRVARSAAVRSRRPPRAAMPRPPRAPTVERSAALRHDITSSSTSREEFRLRRTVAPQSSQALSTERPDVASPHVSTTGNVHGGDGPVIPSA